MLNTDSVSAYEKHARNFLQNRDRSTVGIRVTKRWAYALNHGADVVEIACGGGLPVTRILVESGLRLRAIDSSPTLVTVFKERFPDIPVQCSTVLESDFFGREYDAAISIGLIFLLSRSEQVKMLGRVSKILRAGGSFLFTASVEVGSWEDTGTGHSCLSLGREAYEHALQQAGFRVVERHQDSGKNNYYEAEKVAEPEPGPAT